MLMPVPRLRFYAGVGFVTAATLMLQIVETQNHLRHLLVSPRLLRHQHRHVRAHRRRGVGLSPPRGFAAGRALLRSQRRVSRLCARHGPGAALPADHRHQRAGVGHGLRRVGAVRGRAVAAVLLRRRGGQPGADPKPLSGRRRLRRRPVRGGAWMPRGARAPEPRQRSLGGPLDRRARRRGRAPLFGCEARRRHAAEHDREPASPAPMGGVRRPLRARRRQQPDHRGHSADRREGQARAAGAHRL